MTDKVVEVITPTGAPHLARVADEIEAQLLKQIDALPTDALIRLLREGDAIAQAREEYDRFWRRIGA
jgi:hypothetical protein